MEDNSYYKRLAEKNKPEDPAVGNLENNSYYDIDMLEKINRPINKKIEKLEQKKQEASSWLGKWYWQVKIDKLKEKLFHYE